MLLPRNIIYTEQASVLSRATHMTYLYLGFPPDTPAPVPVRSNLPAVQLGLCCNVGSQSEERGCVGKRGGGIRVHRISSGRSGGTRLWTRRGLGLQLAVFTYGLTYI